MGFLIAGIVLIVVAVVLWFMRKKKSSKVHYLEYTETSKIKDIKENQLSMSDSFGAGNFSLYAEVKGKAMAETPVIAEFSKTKCVYSQSTVTREYEVLEDKKDAEGNYVKKWVRKTEIVSSHTNVANDFVIDDGTGEILVNTDGAELNTKVTFSKFEKGEEPSNKGGINFSIGGFSMSSGSTIRTIGYKYSEFSIPLHTSLYVIGDANDRSGRLQISKPTEKKVPFIISTKSEEEITDKLNKSANWMLYSAIASGVIGLGLTIYGIIKSI